MDELEKEWQLALDGFASGVDFKTWLGYQVIALREQVAAQHILAGVRGECACGNAISPDDKCEHCAGLL